MLALRTSIFHAFYNPVTDRRRPKANFNEALAELRAAPPEEMAEFMRAVQSILESDRAEVNRRV